MKKTQKNFIFSLYPQPPPPDTPRIRIRMKIFARIRIRIRKKKSGSETLVGNKSKSPDSVADHVLGVTGKRGIEVGMKHVRRLIIDMLNI